MKRHILTLTKSSGDDFNYQDLQPAGTHRKPGAFRVVEVAGLRTPPHQIKLWEYTNIRFGKTPEPWKQLRNLNRTPATRYVAISHVWSNGADVEDQLNEIQDTTPGIILHVDVDKDDDPDYQERLSWDGLRQAANAAYRTNAHYIWLDFLCLDQKGKKLPSGEGDKEMGLQICIMADIYRRAWRVITMIGGIGAVTGIDQTTSWMDRAWTLQEAILNPRTWVVVSCPSTQGNVNDPNSTAVWKFWKITDEDIFRRDPTTSVFLIKLIHLLNLADANPYPSIHVVPPVGVLDGAYPDVPSDSPRRALRAALCMTNRQIRYTGVWRSMFMRTSSKPADVVYSIMGIFGLQIDPYRQNRTPKFVFMDLVRKTAAASGIHPAWLTIGGVAGSDIPRDGDSGIAPKFPHYEKAGEKSDDEPPEMTFPDPGKDWVGYHVDDTQYYIRKYNIRFVTQSFPHIINCIMLSVNGPLYPRPKKKLPAPQGGQMRRNYADFRIGPLYGKCVYYGKLEAAVARGKVKAVLVGEVGDMADEDPNLDIPTTTPPKMDFTGYQYFLFLEWTSRGWSVVADGVYKPNRGWPLPRGTQRRIITVGRGAQTDVPSWPVDNSNGFDTRQGYLSSTYGVEPLEDWRVSRKERDIAWFGLKKSRPLTRFEQYDMRLDISDLVGNDKKLNQTLATIRTLHAVSTLADWGREPPTIRTDTPFGIVDEGTLPVALSYDGWKKSECADLHKAGVTGILIPRDKNGGPADQVTYWVRLWFGEQVIYIQMKSHKDTPSDFWQIAVIPYSWGTGLGRKFRNDRYITNENTFSAPEGAHIEGPPLARPDQDAYTKTMNWNLSAGWLDFQRRMKDIGVQPTPAGWRQESWARARQAQGPPPMVAQQRTFMGPPEVSAGWMDFQSRMKDIGVHPTPEGWRQESWERARRSGGF